MSEHPEWRVGDRNPSITDTVTIDGVAQDLTGKTGRFKMRAVGSSTLKVDQPVSNTLDTSGVVRYDWGATDLDTANEYLVWWEITTAGKIQSVREATIRVRAHTAETNAYLELEEAKSTLEIEVGHADSDLLAALVAASRAVDEITQTRFFTTTSDEVRYYTPDAPHVLFTDDINTLTEVAVASAGGTTFTVWTANTDFAAEPLNAVVDGRPWHTLRTMSRSGRYFAPYVRSVRVTGKFGWATPPEAVRVATGIVAAKIVKRAKDAPMGVLTFFDGSAVRLSRFDPQVEELLAPYNRSTPFA